MGAFFAKVWATTGMLIVLNGMDWSKDDPMSKRQNIFSKMLAVAIATIGLSGPAAAQDAQAVFGRLKEIHRMVMDPSQTFSISATLAELDNLAPRIPRDATESLGELNYLRGFILYRAGRASESVPASVEALRIDAGTPFLTKAERARFTYNLASQAEDIGDWDIAIDNYRKAIDLFDGDPDFSDDQKLGTRERLAFCLHEVGRYAEAMAINEKVLQAGETLFGQDSEKLLVVITDLAQNAYKLNQPMAARRFLERRYSIATKHGNQNHIDASLFQLGVLAFEQGDKSEAKAFMDQRLKLAKESGDLGRVHDAERDLQTLREKMGD